MTPDEIAEKLEQARYEGLRGSVWTDLREGERATRVDLAKRALEQAGVTALLADLTVRAERSADLEGLLAQRDAEIGRRIDEHEAELTELRAERDAAVAALEAERDAAVAALEAELDRTRGDLDEARVLGAAAESRADAAEATVAAVRRALESSDEHAEHDRQPTPAVVEQQTEDAPDLVTRMVPKSRFGRLARSDRS